MSVNTQGQNQIQYTVGADFFFDNSNILADNIVYQNIESNIPATTLQPIQTATANYFLITNLAKGQYDFVFFKTQPNAFGINIKSQIFNYAIFVNQVQSEQLASLYKRRDLLKAQLEFADNQVSSATDSAGTTIAKNTYAQVEKDYNKVLAQINALNFETNDINFWDL